MKRTKSEQSVLSTSNSPHQWPSGCCCRSRFSWARLIACEISVSSAEYDSTSCGLALDNEITSLDRLMIVDLLIADRTFVDLKMLAPPRLQRVCPQDDRCRWIRHYTRGFRCPDQSVSVSLRN